MPRHIRGQKCHSYQQSIPIDVTLQRTLLFFHLRNTHPIPRWLSPQPPSKLQILFGLEDNAKSGEQQRLSSDNR
ncbi:hypothetical protein NPIL_470421, partial [Nephila pilipes]